MFRNPAQCYKIMNGITRNVLKDITYKKERYQNSFPDSVTM